MKPMAEWLRDVVDPGWRERERAHIQPFLDAIEIRCKVNGDDYHYNAEDDKLIAARK